MNEEVIRDGMPSCYSGCFLFLAGCAALSVKSPKGERYSFEKFSKIVRGKSTRLDSERILGQASEAMIASPGKSRIQVFTFLENGRQRGSIVIPVGSDRISDVSWIPRENNQSPGPFIWEN